MILHLYNGCYIAISGNAVRLCAGARAARSDSHAHSALAHLLTREDAWSDFCHFSLYHTIIYFGVLLLRNLALALLLF